MKASYSPDKSFYTVKNLSGLIYIYKEMYLTSLKQT